MMMMFAAPLVVLELGGLFSGGHRAVDTGATPPAQLSASACRKCHESVVDEWRSSRHGTAWTNAIFRREYREVQKPWCVHCHAPLRAQHDEVASGGGALADEGVNCAACHLRDGRFVSSRRKDGSPHDTIALPGFDGAEMCAGCHQFNFPVLNDIGEVARDTPYPMQDTVRQFRQGPFSDGTCLDCHARGTRGHGHPGAHDPTMLRLALGFEVCRSDSGNIDIVVSNRGAGHNVPTGDVHRHVVARAWRSTAPEKMFEHSFGRRYATRPDGGKETTLDTTLRPGERRRLRVRAASLGEGDGDIDFELRYVYTIDEFPDRRRPLAEPAYQTVHARRARASILPVCQ